MIRFSLRCASDHHFDSWFQSNATYDKLDKAGLLSCPTCGCDRIEKNLMAPGVHGSTPAEPEAKAVSKKEVFSPSTPAEKALVAIKNWVEKNSEYVGPKFAQEARAIHDGESPRRSIFGEAGLDEAAALLEEGVPVAPLPWPHSGNTN